MTHHVEEEGKPFNIAKFSLGDTFERDEEVSKDLIIDNGYVSPSPYTLGIFYIYQKVLGVEEKVALTKEEIIALYKYVAS